MVNYSGLSVCFLKSQVTDRESELQLDAPANPIHPLKGKKAEAYVETIMKIIYKL